MDQHKSERLRANPKKSMEFEAQEVFSYFYNLDQGWPAEARLGKGLARERLCAVIFEAGEAGEAMYDSLNLSVGPARRAAGV